MSRRVVKEALMSGVDEKLSGRGKGSEDRGAEVFSRRFWYRNCEGFRALTEDECLGYVEAVVFRQQSEPGVIVVRMSSGEQLTLQPEQIQDIFPREERLVVRWKEQGRSVGAAPALEI